MRPSSVTTALAVLVLCLLPSTASARTWESIIQDDARFLHRDDAQTRAAVGFARGIGYDRIRVSVVWRDYAPEATSTHRPAFEATDPGAYPADGWRPLDRLVRVAHETGVKVGFDIGLQAPAWAAGGDRGQTRPSPRHFGQFARAVATRYSGAYTPSGSTTPLPRVALYTIWNEPNWPGWLSPQWTKKEAVAPHLYRALVYEGGRAVKAVRPGNRVLVGGTSPEGGARAGRGAMAPLRFLREFACVDRRYRPIRTGRCKGFKRIVADGWAHHPYALRVKPHERSPRSRPGDVRLADVPRLAEALKRLQRQGRISRGVRHIWLTEFGYESNDPVHVKPWTPAQQAALLVQGERLARCVPGVVSWPQFLLADIETDAAVALAGESRTRRAPGSWQTGLLYEDSRPKPALTAAVVGLDVSRRAGERRARLWGHVRPARQPVTVRLERQEAPGRPWSPMLRMTTDARGFFGRTVPILPGQWRAVWERGAGPVEGLAVQTRTESRTGLRPCDRP